MDHETEIEYLRAQVEQTRRLWRDDIIQWQASEASLSSEVEQLKQRLADAEESARKDADLLFKRTNAADVMLGYLKSKAEIMVITKGPLPSVGVMEGVGLVAKESGLLAERSKPAKLQLFETESKGSEEKAHSNSGSKGECRVSEPVPVDEEYIDRTAVTVMQTIEAMELMLRRTILAETEAGFERKRSALNQDMVVKKTAQIELMLGRVEAMEKVASGTRGVLKEIQQKLDKLEEETGRLRERAAENEEELARMRREFEVLGPCFSLLVRVGETFRSMAKHLANSDDIQNRLLTRMVSLELEKSQKSAEAERLLLENDRLRGTLDLKVAELAGLSDQIRILMDQPEPTTRSLYN